MAYRILAPGLRAQMWIGGPGIRQPDLLFETDTMLIEAPNWSLDDASLFVNAHGLLWRLDLRSPEQGLVSIAFEGLPELNNDHVLDPDGEHIYMSVMDGHIYRGALTGGAVDKVSPEDGHWHFLHGVSPDGSRLAYVHIADFADPGRLAVMQPHGSPVVVDTGRGHLDGPEWSPDGGPVELLVASDTVDRFPHLSPDSQTAAYIAFPAGTLGHPADLPVEVRVVAASDWSTPLQRYPVFSGQETLNVNSWSPDSTRVAFVAYPHPA